MTQTDEMYAEYNAAIGLLMVARAEYRIACEDGGAESAAAMDARVKLDQAIDYRDQVRARYDAASRP